MIPVIERKTFKCFKLKEIIVSRKLSTALIIVLIIVTILMMTTVMFLSHNKGLNDENGIYGNIIEPSNSSVIQQQSEIISRDSWTSIKHIIGKRKQLIPIQRVIIMEIGLDSCATVVCMNV